MMQSLKKTAHNKEKKKMRRCFGQTRRASLFTFVLFLMTSQIYARENIPNTPGLVMRFLSIGITTSTATAQTSQGRVFETITTGNLLDDFTAEFGYAFNSKVSIHAGIYYRHVRESFNETNVLTITAIPFGVTFYTKNHWYFSPILFLTPSLSIAGNRLSPHGLSYGLTFGWEQRVSDFWSVGIGFRFWRFETTANNVRLNNITYANYRRQDTILSALTLSVSYR